MTFDRGSRCRPTRRPCGARTWGSSCGMWRRGVSLAGPDRGRHRAHARHGLEPRRGAHRPRAAAGDGDVPASWDRAARRRPGARRRARRHRARGERGLRRGVGRGSDRGGPVREALVPRESRLRARPRARPAREDRPRRARRAARGPRPIGFSVAVPGWSRRRRARSSSRRTRLGERPRGGARGEARSAGARRERVEPRRARRALDGGRSRDRRLRLRLRRGRCRWRRRPRRSALPRHARVRRRVRPRVGRCRRPAMRVRSRGCVETVVGQNRSPRRRGSRSPAARASSPTSSCDSPKRAPTMSCARSTTPAAGWGSRSRRRSTCSTSRPWCSADASGRSRRGCRRGPTNARGAVARRPVGDAVLPSAFGDGAALRGAAALSLHRVLDQPWTAQVSNGNGAARRPGSAPRSARPRKEVAIGLDSRSSV